MSHASTFVGYLTALQSKLNIDMIFLLFQFFSSFTDTMNIAQRHSHMHQPSLKQDQDQDSKAVQMYQHLLMIVLVLHAALHVFFLQLLRTLSSQG